MKSLSLFLILGFVSLAGAQDGAMSVAERRDRCYSLLVNEFQNAMFNDNGLIQAQLTLTGMKLAKLMAKKNKTSELNSPRSLSKYAKHFMNEDLIARLDQDSKSLERIADMYKSYRSKNKLQIMPKLEVYHSLWEMLQKNQVSDRDAGALMLALNALEEDASFDENDFAVSWFINQASQNFTGSDSHYLSELVQTALESSNFKDELEREKFIAKNMAQARLKIKAKLAGLKEKVFEANRTYCIGDYQAVWNGQNRSVFEGCRAPEEMIVNEAFLDGIQKILQNEEITGFKTELSLSDGRSRKLSSHDIRAIQDHLNSDMFDDKQRVVEFYKRGVYPDDGKCQTFTIVDKKNQATSVYTVDGEEIFTTNTIQARPRVGEEQVVFNPDGELRKFENGTYTRTTSAGVFYSILDMDPAERKRRLYHKEFDDRVFVISPRERRNGEYVYNDSTTIALHGVPINGWVDNSTERLASFEKDNRSLSTGCVNMEAYAFDLLNNLSQNHCPLYILPEDDENYLHIKNREIQFSTSSPERKSGKEPAKYCKGGKVELKERGKECVGGVWSEDPDNVNQYYFSKLSSESHHDYVEVEGESAQVVNALFSDRERLINKVVANNIDSEDFEDLVSLVYATSAPNDVSQGEAKFKDLYNAYYALRERKKVNFDLMTVSEKRERILKYYLDPNGFERDRKNVGRSAYAEIDRSKAVSELLGRAKKVRFIHED